MITYQREQMIDVSGVKLVVITRLKLVAYWRNSGLVFVGNKSPIAIICSGDREEKIFVADDQCTNTAALQSFINEQDATKS